MRSCARTCPECDFRLLRSALISCAMLGKRCHLPEQRHRAQHVTCRRLLTLPRKMKGSWSVRALGWAWGGGVSTFHIGCTGHGQVWFSDHTDPRTGSVGTRMGWGQTELRGWVLAGEDALYQVDSLPWKFGVTSAGRVAGKVVG